MVMLVISILAGIGFSGMNVLQRRTLITKADTYWRVLDAVDGVRDVAALLNLDDRIQAYVVESENFESIHNHSAYALIERDKAAR